MLHGAGWVAAAIILWQNAVFHCPGDSVFHRHRSLASRAACRVRSTPPPGRRLGVLATAAVAFVAVPLPKQFAENVMPGGPGIGVPATASRHGFRVSDGFVNFHSHLSDVVITALDDAFGRSDSSPARAYDTLSRLAGLLFLIELGIVAAWHRWSRQSCRFVGLAMAAPPFLLYFGYWDLGYLSIAVGVVPLLALAGSRNNVQAQASTLVAGFLQGLHTALHGFGMLGLAGGALAALSGRGDALRRACAPPRLRHPPSPSSSRVGVPVRVRRQPVHRLGSDARLPAVVRFDRLRPPDCQSAAVSGRAREFGLFSALSGVPILAASVSPRSVQPESCARHPLRAAWAGVLVRWWPLSAPFNLDLLLSVFPGSSPLGGGVLSANVADRLSPARRLARAALDDRRQRRLCLGGRDAVTRHSLRRIAVAGQCVLVLLGTAWAVLERRRPSSRCRVAGRPVRGVAPAGRT